MQCVRIQEARRAQHRHKELRRACSARQPVDHDRDRVPGIVDEQLVSGPMRLPHRHRQAALPGPVELAEPGIPIPVRMANDILVPEDRQRDVLALEFPVDGRPVRVGMPTMPDLLAGRRKQPGFQRCIRLVRCNPVRQPAAATWRSVSLTVDAATPTQMPICRVEIPA